jgi:signal transduction histidine kinase
MRPFSKKKRLAIITIAYWFLLSYLIAALAWWFIELWQQNSEMFLFKKELLQQNDPSYPLMIQRITEERDLNNAQYIGEGFMFLLLTLMGAIFVYRATRRQIRLNNQQQNFMMALTHELKTPIAITKLNLETLNRHALDTEKQKKIIDSTLQETNRLNDLCNNILLSSQLDAGGVGAQSHAGNHRIPQRIRAEVAHDIEWIDAVAQRLAHLHVIRVAHGAVQVHGSERRFAAERVPHHDHPGDPEE